MNTQTSLVAEQIRLQQWADQIRDCQNRPSDMKVDVWCQEHGITKANYYYRLRRVREACLELCDPAPSFVELTTPPESTPAKASPTHSSVAAVLLFFVKHFSLKKASEFPVSSKGFSRLLAGDFYASRRMRACSMR